MEKVKTKQRVSKMDIMLVIAIAYTVFDFNNIIGHTIATFIKLFIK